jgi:hypothetical protein
MTMVEDLARTLCRAELLRTLNMPISQQGPFPGNELAQIARRVVDVVCDERWPEYVPAVLAMLATLRTPTDGMLDAGFQAMWKPDDVRAVWQAMIDAAVAYPCGGIGSLGTAKAEEPEI